MAAPLQQSREIQIVEVALQRLDGPREAATVRTIAEANRLLAEWARTVPKAKPGYHRIAYRLQFDCLRRDYIELYRLRQADAAGIHLEEIVRDALERSKVLASRRTVLAPGPERPVTKGDARLATDLLTRCSFR